MKVNFQVHSINDNILDLYKYILNKTKTFFKKKCLPLTVFVFLVRICLEIVRIRVKWAINWSIIKRDCCLCIKLDDGKSPQDELRISSCWSWTRRRRRFGDEGDFCRNLLFINGEFFDGDVTRWWTIGVGDGERVGCLRVLFGLGRFFNNNWS